MTLLEQRRHGSLWSAMIADPLRKLAAVALAVGLWYYLDDQRSDQQTLTMKLDTTSSQTAGLDRSGLFVRLVSDEYIGTFYNADDSTKLDTVEITLRGPRERVDSAAAGLVLTVDMAKIDWTATPSREFTINDCRLERAGFSDLALAMTPPRVRLAAERLDRKGIAISEERVKVTYENDELKRRILMRTAKFTPSMPLVHGPASLVKKLQEDITNGTNPTPFLAQFKGSTTDLRMTVGVTLEVPGLKLLDQVNLEVEVEPQFDEFTLDVPLLPNYASLPPGLRYAPESDVSTLSVKVMASGELRTLLKTQEGQTLADWVRKNLVLMPQVQANATDPQPELSVQALLYVIGPLHDRISPKEYRLAETVAISFKLIQ